MTSRTMYGAAAVSYELRTAGAPSLLAISMAVDEGPVGAGGSGSRYIRSPEGDRWVMKSHVLGGQEHAYLCLNEAVAFQLATRIGANVPRAAVVELSLEQLEVLEPSASPSARFMFASEFITGAEALSPSAASAVDPVELAGIVALDAVARNTDRKPEHVLARERGGAWDAFAIDHGHSMAVASTLSAFTASEPMVAPMPLLQQHIGRADFGRARDAAGAIERREVVAMVEGLPTPWVIEPDGSATLADVLMVRLRDLDRLLAPHFPD